MTHDPRFGGMSVSRVHPRHISSALMVCQSIGFTHRRIHRASPLYLTTRSRSFTHSVRSLCPLCMCMWERHNMGSLGKLHPVRTIQETLRIDPPVRLIRIGPPTYRIKSVEYTTESTHLFRFGGISVNRLYPRQISSALMVCKSLGFTHDTYLPL